MMDFISIKLSYTNCYLIPVDSKYLLVDTGYAWEWKIFKKQLLEHHIAISDIRYLLITHHHEDHTGFISFLTEQHPDVRVIISSKSIDLLKPADHQSNRFMLNSFWQTAFTRTLLAGMWPDEKNGYAAREQDIVICHDVLLREKGINLAGRIIETPGHSDDSISMILDNGYCFCGDASASQVQSSGIKYCVMSAENKEAYYESWGKMLGGGARHIFPGHGKDFHAVVLQHELRKYEVTKVVLMYM
jgi:glyoxylase-like metal-dependent hydrolase (beta-lactamase superfamily II)